MRRCYAHVPAAENPLRPEAPKSPWSRRIPFPAPSGHFRIVLFLIGLIGCLCLFSPACRSVYRFFFVLYPASVSYGFVLRFSLGAYVFRLFFLILCFPMVPWLPPFSVLPFSVRVPFSDGGFCVPWFSFFVRIGVPMRFVSRGCVSTSLVASVFRRRFFHWGFHVVRPSLGFLY